MSLQRWLLAFILVDFTAFTVWVAADAGWTGFVATFESGPWAIQLALDLLISLGLVLTWIVRDARSRGMSPVFWVVFTLLTGSIGPLLYLTLRPANHRAARALAARAQEG